MATVELNEKQVLTLIEAIDWADRELYLDTPENTPEGWDIHNRWMALRTTLEIALGRNVEPFVM